MEFLEKKLKEDKFIFLIKKSTNYRLFLLTTIDILTCLSTNISSDLLTNCNYTRKPNIRCVSKKSVTSHKIIRKTSIAIIYID